MRGCTLREVDILCSNTILHQICHNHSSLPPPSPSSLLSLGLATTGLTLPPLYHHKHHLNHPSSLLHPSNIMAMGIRAINITELPSISNNSNNISSSNNNSNRFQFKFQSSESHNMIRDLLMQQL